VYDIIHPLQQMSAPRDLRLTPFHRRHTELKAEFFSGAGWERPQWFDANLGASEVPADAAWRTRNAWAAQNWSPAVGDEHLAVRERVGLFDITPFFKIIVQGPDAAAYLERICANTITSRAIGSVTYTAILTPSGGIRCDLTVTRLGEDTFQVVTGGGSGMHDLAWMRRQAMQGGDLIELRDITNEDFSLGLWGPRARDVLQQIVDHDVSSEAFPYLTAQPVAVGEVPVLAQRISYAGELGWELYGPMEMGERVWDLLWAAGQEHGIVAAGGGAFDSLRLEKGYRLWAQDIDADHDPFSAGLGFAVKMDKPSFQGKAALEQIRAAGGPTRKLACMTLDDRGAVVMGKEPIWSEGAIVGYVTSAAYGYSIGHCIVYGYLPTALAVEGTSVEVEYFDERFAATVAADPLWDPTNERQKV